MAKTPAHPDSPDKSSTEKSRLDKLHEQQRALEAKIRAIEEREKDQAKKDEARRRTLLGMLVIDQLAKHPDDPFSQSLQDFIDRSLSKPADRKLFNLAAKKENQK